MSRRTDFTKILNHEKPERLILDLGGNPLSSMEGDSPDKLLKVLGYEPVTKENPPFGKVNKVDDRILEYLDIDTRSVGTILTPSDSLYEQLSKNLYIDEWGIKRKFTGMYWDIVEYPLKGTTADDLDDFKWPNPQSIDFSLIEKYAQTAKNFYENTDYVICAEHPVYGIFEIGCWMCGFDDYLIKMAIDEDYIKKFSERYLEYQRTVSEYYYKEVGPYVHYTSSGDDFATQNSLFTSPDMFRKNIKPYFTERVKFTKEMTDAAFLHHSCGNVHDIIDEIDSKKFIDLGSSEESIIMTTWRNDEILQEALYFFLNETWPDEYYEGTTLSSLAIVIGNQEWSEIVKKALMEPGKFNDNYINNEC